MCVHTVPHWTHEISPPRPAACPAACLPALPGGNNGATVTPTRFWWPHNVALRSPQGYLHRSLPSWHKSAGTSRGRSSLVLLSGHPGQGWDPSPKALRESLCGEQTQDTPQPQKTSHRTGLPSRHPGGPRAQFPGATPGRDAEGHFATISLGALGCHRWGRLRPAGRDIREHQQK